MHGKEVEESGYVRAFPDFFNTAQREEMEQDAEEKMEETKEDIDEAVHNPVSPCSSREVSS